LILPPDKREQLMQNIALILQMAHHPHPRMHALVVPALIVHPVGTNNLQLAVLDLPGQRPNPPPILMLEEPPLRSRKHQQWCPPMPKNERLHVAMQFLAIS